MKILSSVLALALFSTSITASAGEIYQGIASVSVHGGIISAGGAMLEMNIASSQGAVTLGAGGAWIGLLSVGLSSLVLGILMRERILPDSLENTSTDKTPEATKTALALEAEEAMALRQQLAIAKDSAAEFIRTGQADILFTDSIEKITSLAARKADLSPEIAALTQATPQDLAEAILLANI